MIQLRFFARYREMLDCEQESLAFSEDLQTVEKLISYLALRGNRWADVFASDQRILVAINQDMVQPDTVIHDGDEVAFFPPVTGG